VRAGEVLAVVAEGVDRRVVDAGLDTGGFHGVLEGGAVGTFRQENGHEVAGRNSGMIGEGDGEPGGKMLAQQSDDLAPALVVGGQFPELLNSQRCPDLVDAIVVSQRDHIVGVGMPGVAIIGQGGHAVRAQQLDFCSNLVGIGRQHPAFSRCQVFIGEEGKAADIPPGAERFALQARPRAVGGILDDVQVVSPRDLEDGGHIAGIAGVVHDDDGFGARGDAGGDGCRGDGEVVGTSDVGEDHTGAGVEDGVGRRDEGERWDDNLVAWANAEGYAGQVQGFGGVGDAEAVRAAGELGEVVLELSGNCTHGEPLRVEDGEDGGVFVLVVG